MAATGLPVVEGLTETSRDAEPLHVRLMQAMSERRGGSSRKVADALALLEDATTLEGDAKVRERIQAAVALIRGTGRKMHEDDE